VVLLQFIPHVVLQMEFAEGKGLPVKVLGEKSTQGPALDANFGI
jgi:hypothetical protein